MDREQTFDFTGQQGPWEVVSAITSANILALADFLAGYVYQLPPFRWLNGLHKRIFAFCPGQLPDHPETEYQWGLRYDYIGPIHDMQ